MSLAVHRPQQGHPLVVIGHVGAELRFHQLVPHDGVVLIAEAPGGLERLLHHGAQFRIALSA